MHTITRRGFLGSLIGGVAVGAAQSWPFRVFSFPTSIQIAKKIPTGLRFVKAFDPRCGRMLTRFDTLYGFQILDPSPTVVNIETDTKFGVDWEMESVNA